MSETPYPRQPKQPDDSAGLVERASKLQQSLDKQAQAFRATLEQEEAESSLSYLERQLDKAQEGVQKLPDAEKPDDALCAAFVLQEKAYAALEKLVALFQSPPTEPAAPGLYDALNPPDPNLVTVDIRKLPKKVEPDELERIREQKGVNQKIAATTIGIKPRAWQRFSKGESKMDERTAILFRLFELGVIYYQTPPKPAADTHLSTLDTTGLPSALVHICELQTSVRDTLTQLAGEQELLSPRTVDVAQLDLTLTAADVKQIRTQLGLSLTEAAAAIGVKRDTWKKYENPERSAMDDRSAILIRLLELGLI